MTQISVIVPIYNTEKYLDRCIQSILAQTYTDFELLLVDDGSTDTSGAICDKYAEQDSRVRVFHKENGGVSSARNMGLDNAQGEWVTFVDADDWLENGYLEIFMKNTEELTCQSFHSYYEGQKEAWDTTIYNTNGINNYIEQLYNKRILGYCWGILFKTQIIRDNNIKFYSDVKFREDEIFVLEYISYIKGITFINEYGYNYNRPDWSKYDKCYDYITRFLLYQKYKLIFPTPNEITDKYLLDLVGYIINQYNIKKRNYKALKEIQKITKKDINRMRQISMITKLIWRTYPLIIHYYLILKSKFVF
jgi:glycosyltransferase involved in cell wall biosynthesis